MNLKPSILASSALFSVALATCAAPSAFAQQAQATTTQSDEEVIVNAQRRAQRLEDVPISVTALTSSQLDSQGLKSTHDLAQAVTGMTITESGGYVQPFIRGIGSTVTNLGEQGSAATYIDGVYMPMVSGQWYDLANLQSIEVLKGPQGTLFGRNANSGAILITTRAPSSTPSGNFQLGYGNLNSVSGRGYVTGPVGDNIAVSLAGNYDSHDGYIRDLYTGGNTIGDGERYTLRGAALFQLTDNFKFTLAVDTQHSSDPTPILTQPINGYQGYLPGGLLPQGPRDFVGNENVGYVNMQTGYSGRAQWDLGSVDFTSTTAVRHYVTHSINYDSDTTPTRFSQISNKDEGTQTTQEFQLNSHQGGNFNWVLGAFYMDQESDYRPLLVASTSTVTSITAQQTTRSYAAFADGTYDFGPIELTLGIRYSKEDKAYDGQRNGVQLVTNAHKTWESTTPRAVIAYHPSEDFMAYFSYSQGFKAGTFNANGLSSTPVNPETVDAYEAGIKWTPANNVVFNAAVFDYQTSDMQVQALNPSNNLITIINAAEAESKGVDMDLSWRPTSDLAIRAGLSYLDATFTSFPNAQVYIPVVGGDGRNQSVIKDVTGNHQVRSPEWTSNIAVDYTFHLADGGTVVPSANVYSTSEFYWEVNNRIKEPSHTLINGQITWNLPGNNVALSVWARNLTDEVVFRNVSAAAQADRRAADEPRTYGVRVGYSF